MRLKKKKDYSQTLQNTTRGPAQMRLIFKVKNHLRVRDEDSSKKQKQHSTHKTSRKDSGQIHVLFYIHTCTRIYIVFNRHHIYILAALSACAQLGAGTKPGLELGGGQSLLFEDFRNWDISAREGKVTILLLVFPFFFFRKKLYFPIIYKSN